MNVEIRRKRFLFLENDDLNIQRQILTAASFVDVLSESQCLYVLNGQLISFIPQHWQFTNKHYRHQTKIFFFFDVLYDDRGKMGMMGRHDIIMFNIFLFVIKDKI